MLGRDRRKNLALDFVKAERDNERLAAQEAARKSHEPAVEKPSSPAAPSMVQASRAHADAEAIAKKKILTPVAVFHMMQETAPDRQHVREAVEARDWWRNQVDAYQQNRPLSAKLGLRKPPIVTCPMDGQTMRLQEGLDAAEARLAAAAAKLEALRDVPAIWRKAVEQAEKHNAPILQAQAQLPALEKGPGPLERSRMMRTLCNITRALRLNHKARCRCVVGLITTHLRRATARGHSLSVPLSPVTR